MIGFVLKDMLVMRKMAKSYLLMLGVYLILVISGAFSPSVFSGFLVVMVMMIPISSFSYDELARWDKFAASTPAGRRGVVRGKYVFCLLLVAFSFVIVLGFNLCYFILTQNAEDLLSILLSTLVCAVLGLLMNAFTLPLIFKLGAEKSRVLMMASFAALFLSFILVAKLLTAQGAPAIPDWVVFSLPAVGLGLIAVALILSYSASLRIYENKEL